MRALIMFETSSFDEYTFVILSFENHPFSYINTAVLLHIPYTFNTSKTGKYFFINNISLLMNRCCFVCSITVNL